MCGILRYTKYEHNMGFWKNLICWRRRTDFQERSEGPRKKPKEERAKLKELVAKLRNRASEQKENLEEQSRVMDALRDNTIREQEVNRNLKKKIIALIEENKKLRTKYKEADIINERVNTRIAELENIVEEKDLEMKNMEDHHQYRNNELRLRFRKLCENRKEEEAALKDRIQNLNLKFIDLQKENKEEDSAPPGNIRIKELHIMVGEEDLESKNTEAFHNCVINELCVRLRESNRNTKEEEAALHDKKLNKKLEDTKSEKKQLECVPSGKLKKLVAVGVGVAMSAAVVLGSFYLEEICLPVEEHRSKPLQFTWFLRLLEDTIYYIPYSYPVLQLRECLMRNWV